MIYRYTLKPTHENSDFITRTINGVNLKLGHWSYSDIPLSFSGFEDSVIEERAQTREAFGESKPVATRVMTPSPAPAPSSAPPLPSPPVAETPAVPINTKAPARSSRSSSVVIYSDRQLRDHLMSRGFSKLELVGYSNSQLYELLWIDDSIRRESPAQGDNDAG